MDNVNEKWSGDTEIKSTGKWADKTIAELKKARSALKDKEDRTKEETSKLRQINFAIRSKKDWKGGVDEGDGSGSYGGQSPLSYDTQRSSKMKEDEELNEIKTVKTAVGLFPTNDQGGPLSGEEYHVWTMQTDKNPPKERIISQRYQMYLQDFKDYVKTESIHEADDELNEIKRLSGLEEAFAWDEIYEAKRKARTDVDDFDDKEYQLMTQLGDTNYISLNSNDLREFTFAPGISGSANNSVSYTAGSTAYRNFRTFSIKIVLTGTNPTDPPRIRDLRAIALPEGTV